MIGRTLTPEQLVLFKSMVLKGASKFDLQKSFRAGFPVVQGWLDEHGLVTTCGMGPKKKHGRNPMKSLQAWKPPVATTNLGVAVDKLRARFCPVYAEDTAERAFAVPAPHTDDTLFRVGSQRNVTAAALLDMAG